MEEPPLRALRQSVQVRRAETLHRMGRRAEARGVLSRMIRENPVDPEALKRLAICDSGSEDPAQNTKAWQAYAEVLYFLDVVEGSPRPRAQARRELHQALGGAFAPHFLAEKLDPNWQQRVDAQQMMSFLSSPGRVRNFVEHKLLELLNAQLQHRSPLLKLGVTREEGEESRCEAAATLRSYLAEVEELIPSRVRGAFSSLVEGHLERAEETSREPRQLLQKRDVHYAEDRDRHLKVLADLVQLKYKLFASVGQEDSGIEIPSIGVFAELARLDLVPITLSREMATAAAGSVGGMTGEVAQGLMEKLLESAIGRFLDHLFSDGVGQGERRERQFRQMVEDLDRFPSLDPYRGIIDDPQRGYPDVVVRCLQTQPVQFTDEAIRALESLNSRYPEISGVARLLAHGYTATGKKGEAIEILRRAAEKGLSAEGRERCNRQMLELRFQQALDEKDHVGAARLGLTLLAEDDESPGLAQNVIVICSAAAQEGTKGPDRHEVEGAVNAWIHRARANPECPSDGLGEVEGMLENSLLQMTVARAGGSGETRNWSAVLQELEEFENEHPGLANTGYFRMMAHYQLGAAATHDPSEREAALEHFRLAKEDAERLTRDENADQTYREQAKQVLGQLSAVL